jgi:N4-gp56 family major capsid protein
MDQLRFANRLSGRLADQKSVVNFREQSRDALAYAMADRIDQLAFLTLSGVSYAYKNNGSLRNVAGTGQNLSELEFATAVSAPTTQRHVTCITGGDLTDSDGSMTDNFADQGSAVKLSYGHIVELKAIAKERYIRGIRGAGNEEVYHMFVHPRQMADLKLDTDFLTAVRNAGTRGPSNPFFTGHNGLMVDGVMVHEFRHIPTNLGQTADTNVHGGNHFDAAAALFCGAQALAMADIGLPEVVEETFDYGNQHGISIGKIFGLKKPVYRSDHHGSNEDFGVIRCDTAI